MSKLIVLSNRVSLPNPDTHAAGGLAVALNDALDTLGGVWLGWNGEKISDHEDNKFSVQSNAHVHYMTIPLKESQYQHFYSGYSNSVLWPAMHDRDDLIQVQPYDYQIYQEVNILFAQKLAEIASPDDVIWIHDYHFLSVAHHCRQQGMKNRIGFFLHIPFAPLNIWKKIEQSELLLGHLCDYDVIGLQTERDQSLCMEVLKHYVEAIALDAEIIVRNQHLTRIKCYPIGVNPQTIQNSLKSAQADIPAFFDAEDYKDVKTIIGVDRIDYSKGLIERFNAFNTFLERHPEMHQQITELQVACPCRMEIPVYEALYEDLNHKMNQINQEYSQNKWQPINFTHGTVDHDALMQLYRFADICWVSSLRDGMNLVAKEYIAAQDANNPGVLILSKYAGSAEQMDEAILVDPEDRQAMVKALEQAVSMSKVERLERYQQLIKGIKDFDIFDWRDAFLQDLKDRANPVENALSILSRKVPTNIKAYL